MKNEIYILFSLSLVRKVRKTLASLSNFIISFFHFKKVEKGKSLEISSTIEENSHLYLH